MGRKRLLAFFIINKEEDMEKAIFFNSTGQEIIGLFLYDAFMPGKLQDHSIPDSEIGELLQGTEQRLAKGR